MTNPVVALVENRDGAAMAVRFPDTDSLYSWETNNPDVTIFSVVPLVTKAEAIAG